MIPVYLVLAILRKEFKEPKSFIANLEARNAIIDL